MENGLQKGRLSIAGAITVAALISMFIASLLFSVVNIIINRIVDEFGISGTSEGLMASMTNVGYIVSFLIIPMVQGRTKKIPTLIAVCIFQAAFVFTAGMSPNFVFFCTLCVFVGFCTGFLDTYANSCIVDARGKDSPRYLGYLHGLFGVGSLVAPVAFIWLLTRTDWRGIYVVIAAIALVAAPAIYLITRRKDKGEIHASTTEERFRLSDLKSYIRQRRGVMLIAAAFFISFSQASVLMWIMRYMEVEFGEESLGALSLTAYWICATFNRFFLSGIANKAPVKSLILGAILTCAALIAGIVSKNAIVMCIAVGSTGLFSGHFIPVIISENSKGFEGRTTFTTSITNFSMSTARVVAPLAMAFVSGWVSMSFSMTVPVIATFLIMLFAWMILRIKD